jgi:exonuclease III
MSCNVGGLKVNHLEDTKMDAIKSLLYFYAPDTLGLQEIGLNFKHLGPSSQWKERLGWNTTLDGHTTKTINAYNVHYHIQNPTMYGGTALISQGDSTQWASGSGKDPSGLGRWTWVKFKGSHDSTFRIVTFYRPVKRSPHGQLCVAAQHQRFFDSQGTHRDPRQAFLEDFGQALTSWIEAGDRVIVAGDLNQDITSNAITQFFHNLHMTNMIFSRHSPAHAPSTYQRNSQQVSVDGIWCTENIQALNAGYLSWDESPGDHRVLWVDIPFSQLFGHSPPPVWRPQFRKLQLRDPNCVMKYNTLLLQLLLDHDLIRRQFLLEATLQSHPMTPTLLQECHDIDRLTTQCQLQAEKKCRKMRMGAIDFSLATAIPRYKIQFWRLALLRRSNPHLVRSRQWNRAKKKARITLDVNDLSVADLKAHLRQAHSTYKAAKKHHKQHRIDFINTFPDSIKKRILATEESRRKGRICRMITKKLAGGGVTSCLKTIIVDGETITVECNTKTTMEEVLLYVNNNKYQQCDHSPFLQPPLLDLFGFIGNSDAADQVLQGTFVPPPGTDRCTVLLLNHMVRPPNMPSSPTLISTSSNSSAWKKAKEYTTGGKSMIHFGMFKAQASHPVLCAFDASKRSVFYQSGATLDRWKIGIDTMLLKSSGDRRAEKLRTILLTEADWNMNNKQLGKDAMNNAEAVNAISPEQGGGRKNYTAPQISLNDTLTADISRQRRHPIAIISNDAKGCFDRVVHSVAYMCLRRFGAPAAAIVSMLRTIQGMTHHVRTAFGDSTTTYGSRSTIPNQGLLQGNGASGAGFTAVATVMVEAMRSAGYGFSTLSAISQAVFQLVGFQFVDDTTLCHSSSAPQASGAQVLAEVQEVLDTWNGLLRTCGGALSPQKSYWWMLDYKWLGGKWTYKSPSDLPGELHLHDPDTQQIEPIIRLPVTTAKKALGIFKSPDGNMSAQIKFLRSKAIKWSRTVRSTKLFRTDVWYCLNSTIMRTLEYPLLVTTMTKTQCDHIMSPILQAILPSIQVQRNLPRDLVFAPIEFQGLGISCLWATQLISHIQCILKHSSSGNLTGQGIITSMEDLTLELGSGTSFWDLPYSEWSMLATNCWLKFTWRDLDQTPLSLHGPMTIPPLQRLHDSFLMDDFQTSGLFSSDELITLNQVRLWKRVLRISDICTADGINIDSLSFLSTPSPLVTPYKWPRCHPPTPNQLSLWVSALRQVYLPPHAQHVRLRHPLGPWTSDSDISWPWWTDSTNSSVFQYTPQGWYQWLPQPHTSYFEQDATLSPEELPTTLHRISVRTLSPSKVSIKNHGPQAHPQPPPNSNHPSPGYFAIEAHL